MYPFPNLVTVPAVTVIVTLPLKFAVYSCVRVVSVVVVPSPQSTVTARVPLPVIGNAIVSPLTIPEKVKTNEALIYKIYDIIIFRLFI